MISIITIGYALSMVLAGKFGYALRRFRRLNSIKQARLAEILGVSQGNLSRWESGHLQPSAKSRRKIVDLLRASADPRQDVALKNLVSYSVRPVHLICDATHNLLAASPSRFAEWKGTPGDYIGRSLYGYATSEIIEAEEALVQGDWFGERIGSMVFFTQESANADVPIAAGYVCWDAIRLSDGRTARVVSTRPMDA